MHRIPRDFLVAITYFTRLPLLAATALHAKLARLGLAAPARLVSSPLQRCARMARALAGAAGSPGYPAPEFAEALREMHFGNWELRRWDEIPRAEIDAWNADMEHAAPHGGESLAQFSRRLLDWHARMHAEGGAPRRDAGPAAVGTTGAVTERSAGAAGSAEDSEAGAVIIVAHAGVIRLLGAAILDLPLDRVVRWKLDFDGVCAFREGKLVCWNT